MLDPALALLWRKTSAYQSTMFPVTKREAAILINAGYVSLIAVGSKERKVWVELTQTGLRVLSRR